MFVIAPPVGIFNSQKAIYFLLIHPMKQKLLSFNPEAEAVPYKQACKLAQYTDFFNATSLFFDQSDNSMVS